MTSLAPRPGPPPAPSGVSPSGAAPAWRRVLAQAAFEARTILRNGEQLLVTIALPLFLLVGLVTTSVVDLDTAGASRVGFVTPGVLAVAVMSTAFTSQAIATAFDRRNGVLRLLATTPLGRGGLLAGKVLGVLAVELVQVAVLTVVALLLGWQPHTEGVLAAVAAGLLGIAAFTSLALLLAGLLRAEGVLAIANLVLVLLIVGGGVLAPSHRLPGPLAHLASVLPSGALGEAMRGALAGGGVPLASVLVLAGWTAALGWGGGTPLPLAVTGQTAPNGTVGSGTVAAARSQRHGRSGTVAAARSQRHGKDHTVGRGPWSPPPSPGASVVPVPETLVNGATSHSGRPASLRHRFLAGLRRHGQAVLLANVIAQIGIIVTGGAVRLTSSGLGCSEWPLCTPGRFTPSYHPESSFHPFVEFGNRTMSGVLTVIAVLVLLLVWNARGRARSVRRLGAVPLAGVLAQAVVGGVVVLLELDPRWVSLHFAVSAALVWLSAYLLHRWAEGDDAPVPVGGSALTVTGWATAALLVPVIVLGVLVTGSGPHSGDDEVGYRFALDPLAVTRAHSASVWLFVLAVTALVVLLLRTTPSPRVSAARRAAAVLVVVTLLQGAIGYTQYATGLPALLVGIHMLGAGLLIWATAHAVLRLRTRA